MSRNRSPAARLIKAAAAGCIPLLAAAAAFARPPGDPPVPHPWRIESERHPDIAVTIHPYRVRLRIRPRGGPVPPPASGRIVYEVRDPLDRVLASGAAVLVRDDNAWSGSIPAQPAGSTVRYHFELESADGTAVRHPGRPPAAYRFAVRHEVIRSIEMLDGDPAAGRFSVVLGVESEDPPAGECLVQRLSGSAGRRAALEIPWRVAPLAGSPRSYRLSAPLPDVLPGEAAAVAFRIRSGSGPPEVVPSGHPPRPFMMKIPLRRVVPPSGNDTPISLAVTGSLRAAGLAGGGLWVALPKREGGGEQDPGKPSASGRRLRTGLPSGRVRFVVEAPLPGGWLAGTDAGIVSLHAGGRLSLPVDAGPAPGAIGGAVRDEARGRAVAAIRSPLDGSVLAAVELPGSGEPALYEIREGQSRRWAPQGRGWRFTEISSLAFDEIDGCWLIGGRISGRLPRAAIIRRCVDRADIVDLPEVEGGPVSRIPALIRDPADGSYVAAVERAPAGGPGPIRGALYRFDPGRSGSSPSVSVLDATPTSLATDGRGRLWIGTLGGGLLEDHPPPSGPSRSSLHLPDDILELQWDGAAGSLLAATPAGLFEIDGAGETALPVAPRVVAPVSRDAVPGDVEPSTGRVLVTEPERGILQLQAGRDGLWRAGPRWSVEAGGAPTLWGDVCSRGEGRWAAILRSRGLVLHDGEATTLLEPAGGLMSRHLLRALARENGEVWTAATPLPFSGVSGVQILVDGEIIRDIPLADGAVATISDWIDVPERNSVFAATPAGVVEIRPDGALERLSRSSAAAIARRPGGGAIGVAGGAVLRWEDGRFAPVLFDAPPLDPLRGGRLGGGPIGLAIDAGGTWHLLYRGGVIVLLDEDGGYRGMIGPEDGVPPDARSLLAHPATGEIFAGGSSEGIVIISPHRDSKASLRRRGSSPPAARRGTTGASRCRGAGPPGPGYFPNASSQFCVTASRLSLSRSEPTACTERKRSPSG